jgi:hypothetical protein
MEEQPRFRDLARQMLALRGVDADDVELAVIEAVERTYGPDRDRLMAADLSAGSVELGFDPASAPTGPGGRHS